MDRRQGGQLGERDAAQSLVLVLRLWASTCTSRSAATSATTATSIADSSTADLKRRYVDALETEIRRAGDGADADTIFFGGGTPSLLEPEEVGRLIDACRASFAISPDAEVTLETNPETVSAERMRGFRDAGVNRVSLGVQSLHDARAEAARAAAQRATRGATRSLRCEKAELAIPAST